ncbi:unnamed protein product [Linum tenue]|uniref:Uncharacterized protein n=2 Tax=Linum TaxID=4005 RepID=A0AAV0M4H7_9ROSI|nr:unnamed protein product [Linum tenue]
MLRSLSLIHHLPTAFSSARRICLAKMSSTPMPMCPKFIPVEGREVWSRSKADGLRFSVVSYNILAQAYVKSSLFPHSPSACLKWKARSQAILTVLKSLGAEFLCLQELDEYDSFYKPNMVNHGYSSIYIQRTGIKRDGCGIFYKLDCAELLLEERVEYNDLVNSVPDGASSHGDTQKSQHANNVMLIELNEFVVLVPRDPEWADVKLAQAKYLLSRLAKFKMLVSEKFDCAPEVILAGDFNSIPGDKVYRYLVSGDALTSPTVECLDELPIPLRSVYSETRGGEPPFTNCTPSFTNTLDYIFFSPGDQMKPVSFLKLPEADDDADVVGGLPNDYHPIRSMSRRFKRKEEDEGPSEDGHGAPPKKAPRTDSSDDSDEIVVCDISHNRRVKVRNWQGKVWVDIREFYVKDGKQLPGKKGISLSVDQWKMLKDHAEEIDKALAES